MDKAWGEKRKKASGNHQKVPTFWTHWVHSGSKVVQWPLKTTSFLKLWLHTVTSSYPKNVVLDNDIAKIKVVFTERAIPCQWKGRKYFEQCRILLAAVTKIRTVIQILRGKYQSCNFASLVQLMCHKKVEKVLKFKQAPHLLYCIRKDQP